MAYLILVAIVFLVFLSEAVFHKIGLTLIGTADCFFVFLVFAAGLVLYYKLDFGRRFRVILYLAFLFAALYIASFIPSFAPLRSVIFHHVFGGNDVALVNLWLIVGIPLSYVVLHFLVLIVNYCQKTFLSSDSNKCESALE